MEENLSEDEMVGDFVTESDESVVLFCDMLSRVPATCFAPLASKLLGEEESDDLEYVGVTALLDRAMVICVLLG